MTAWLLVKSATFHARDERVLQGGILSLYEIDVADVPTYEAENPDRVGVRRSRLRRVRRS
jgi:hypothetical protein